MAIIDLPGVENVRDLGGIPLSGARQVKRGLLFRGGALAGLTCEGIEKLTGDLKVGTVVDLRTGWERAEKPDPALAGVENHHIPFYDMEKVGIEYTEPAEGTKVVGRDVACNPPRFYHHMANPLTSAQINQALHLVFREACQGNPVYYHCSGGKDRAGILTLCLLTILGASREDILEDYLLTNLSRDANIQPVFERFLKFTDGDEDRAWEITHAHGALAQNLDSFYGSVEEHHGSFEQYIYDQLGFSAEEIEAIREACAEPVA